VLSFRLRPWTETTLTRSKESRTGPAGATAASLFNVAGTTIAVVEATSATLLVAADKDVKIAGRRRTQATATMVMGNTDISHLGHHRSNLHGTLRRQGILDSVWAFHLRRRPLGMGMMVEDQIRRTVEADTISTRIMDHRHLGPILTTVKLMGVIVEAEVAIRVVVATAEVVGAEEEEVVVVVEDTAVDAIVTAKWKDHQPRPAAFIHKERAPH